MNKNKPLLQSLSVYKEYEVHSSISNIDLYSFEKGKLFAILLDKKTIFGVYNNPNHAAKELDNKPYSKYISRYINLERPVKVGAERIQVYFIMNPDWKDNINNKQLEHRYNNKRSSLSRSIVLIDIKNNETILFETVSALSTFLGRKATSDTTFVKKYMNPTKLYKGRYKFYYKSDFNNNLNQVYTIKSNQVLLTNNYYSNNKGNGINIMNGNYKTNDNFYLYKFISINKLFYLFTIILLISTVYINYYNNIEDYVNIEDKLTDNVGNIDTNYFEYIQSIKSISPITYKNYILSYKKLSWINLHGRSKYSKFVPWNRNWKKEYISKYGNIFIKNNKIYAKAWSDSLPTSPVDIRRSSNIIKHASNKKKLNYVSNILHCMINSLSPKL